MNSPSVQPSWRDRNAALRYKEAKIPSNREFGFLFSFMFLLVAAVLLLRGESTHWWVLSLSLLFLLLTLLCPAVLQPLNRSWMRLAELLNRLVSPIVLSLTFFLVMLPFGLLLRFVLRKDPMCRRTAPEISSYWHSRSPSEQPGSMKEQF